MYRLVEVIITKAKTLYSLADKVVRPYTMYVIIRENYEHKEFKQGLWEMWKTIGTLLNSGLDDEKMSNIIDEVADRIFEEYWNYIDNIIKEIRSQKKSDDESFEQCLADLNQMKQRRFIDECALEELRKIEEVVY